MSLRATLLLMIVFMVLGSFALFDPFQWKENRERETEKAGQVVWLEGKRLSRIALSQPPVELRCAEKAGCLLDGAADWDLLPPGGKAAEKADASAVAALANALKNLGFQEKIDFDGAPDPKEFGLGQGRFFEVEPAGEKPVRLELGGPSPVGPNVYLRSSAEPNRLYVVGAFVEELLKKDLFHWRNKRLFPDFAVEKASSLSWKGKETFAAVKEKGEWRLEKPVAAEGNRTMLEGLVSTLAYAGAKAVLDQAPTLGKPVLEIGAKVGKGEKKLELFPRAATATPGVKELVARASGQKNLFVVEAAPFDRFLKPVIEYRERRLFPGLAEASEIELRFPRENKAITVKREGAGWAYVSGEKPAEALSNERLSALAAALLQSEADGFLPAGGPEGKQFSSRKADVEVGTGGNRARFFIWDRKSAITEGRIASEVRSFGEDMLTALPVRFQDLYASNNKVVIPEPTKEQVPHGQPHDHHHH